MGAFLKVVCSCTVTIFAIIGFFFVWSAEGGDDDSVVIEYPCSEVMALQEEYPPQVLRECKKLRGIEEPETKKMKDSI
jgi:hypothetical protein